MLREDAVWNRRGGRWSMMSDMLESLILELRRHHLGFDRAMMGCTRSIVIVVIVIHLSLPAEVRGALVFVGSSIL
jgi:hypothetical protein